MPLLKPHGPDYESLEFKKSEAYADYRAALQTVGCATYAQLLERPRAVRDQFHAAWSDAMRARAGLDGPVKRERVFLVPPDTACEAPGRKGRVARHFKAVREMNEQGASDLEMAQALGLSKSRVDFIRHALGLPPTGAIGRNRALRPKIAEMVAEGYTDTAIAAHLGVTENIVGHQRRLLGLRRNPPQRQAA